MKTKNVTKILFIMAGLAMACSLARGVEGTATVEVASPTPARATPVSDSPAAGICGEAEGEVMTITIYADIPDPRCAKVRPDQKLRIVNGTGGTIEVSIWEFNATLGPREETLFDKPFGEYLMPGVHSVTVLPCCGPELWLEG